MLQYYSLCLSLSVTLFLFRLCFSVGLSLFFPFALFLFAFCQFAVQFFFLYLHASYSVYCTDVLNIIFIKSWLFKRPFCFLNSYNASDAVQPLVSANLFMLSCGACVGYTGLNLACIVSMCYIVFQKR